MSKQIMEISGVKFEVDMREARRIDTFRIGDNIKILKKNYSSHEIHEGVIVDFVNFKDLPTIQVAAFIREYNGPTIKFFNINAETEDMEIVPSSEHETVIERNKVIDRLNNEIETNNREAAELIAKRDWFIKYYGQYFEKRPDNDVD